MEYKLKKLSINIYENIISVIYDQNTAINLVDAMEIYDIISENIDKSIEYGLLTLGINVKSMSREARDFFADNYLPNIKLDAIVYSSTIQKIIADLYISLSHPKVETKIFKNKDNAVNWLKINLN